MEQSTLHELALRYCELLGATKTPTPTQSGALNREIWVTRNDEEEEAFIVRVTPEGWTAHEAVAGQPHSLIASGGHDDTTDLIDACHCWSSPPA